MANVIGGGTGRFLTDVDGDPLGVSSERLNVNSSPGYGSTTFSTYPQITVGTTLVQLSSADGINTITSTVSEMIIQADADNTSFVMVGDDDLAANDTEGIRINAGDTLVLPIAATTIVYFRSDTSSQKVNISLLF